MSVYMTRHQQMDIAACVICVCDKIPNVCIYDTELTNGYHCEFVIVVRQNPQLCVYVTRN